MMARVYVRREVAGARILACLAQYDEPVHLDQLMDETELTRGQVRNGVRYLKAFLAVHDEELSGLALNVSYSGDYSLTSEDSTVSTSRVERRRDAVSRARSLRDYIKQQQRIGGVEGELARITTTLMNTVVTLLEDEHVAAR